MTRWALDVNFALPKTGLRRYTPTSLVEPNAGQRDNAGDGSGRRKSVGAYLLSCAEETTTAEFCCVLGFAGMPALPALLGRGDHLAGPSGFWVGHSGECFTVELMSDREPGLRVRLPGIQAAGTEQGADAVILPTGDDQTHSLSAPAALFGNALVPFNRAAQPIRASPSSRCGRRCP